jgi:hypothetical protein
LRWQGVDFRLLFFLSDFATLHKSEEFKSRELKVAGQRQINGDDMAQLDLALEPTPTRFEDAQGSAI